MELPPVQVPKSGIQKLSDRAKNIESKPVRTLARIGTGILGGLDTVGSAIAPAIAANIPGTRMNALEMQNRELGQRKQQIGEAATQAGTAATQEATREAPQRLNLAEQAEKDKNAAAAAKKGPKSIQEIYATAVQDAVAAGHDPSTDPTVLRLADTITSLRPAPAAPAQKAVTLQLPGGKKTAGKVDHEGNLLLSDGKPAPEGTMLYQQPNYGQLVLPTKTVDVLDENGIPRKMAWNAETQTYDRPVGTSASGAYGHEMAQAGAVSRAGGDLVTQLQDPNNRAILGRLSSYIQQGTLGTPLADAQAARLSSELKTFAALQPAMHGFRSRSAQEAFEKIVGGLAQNPDATIGAIEGILSTAGAINPGLAKSAGGGGSSGKAVSLTEARRLPTNKGKSDAEIRKDIEAHGHQVVE